MLQPTAPMARSRVDRLRVHPSMLRFGAPDAIRTFPSYISPHAAAVDMARTADIALQFTPALLLLLMMPVGSRKDLIKAQRHHLLQKTMSDMPAWEVHSPRYKPMNIVCKLRNDGVRGTTPDYDVDHDFQLPRHPQLAAKRPEDTY